MCVYLSLSLYIYIYMYIYIYIYTYVHTWRRRLGTDDIITIYHKDKLHTMIRYNTRI